MRLLWQGRTPQVTVSSLSVCMCLCLSVCLRLFCWSVCLTASVSVAVSRMVGRGVGGGGGMGGGVRARACTVGVGIAESRCLFPASSLGLSILGLDSQPVTQSFLHLTRNAAARYFHLTLFAACLWGPSQGLLHYCSGPFQLVASMSLPDALSSSSFGVSTCRAGL